MIAFPVVYALVDIPGRIFVGTPPVPVIPLGRAGQTLPGLVPGVIVQPRSGVALALQNPTTQQATLAWLSRVPRTAVYLTFFVLLRQLVRAARRGDPFTAATARRLRFLGGFLFVGALVAALAAEAIIHGLLSRSVTIDRLFFFDWDTPGYVLINGLGLIVVGEIVRRGAAMREDLEGTI